MLVYLVRLHRNLFQFYCSVTHPDSQWFHIVCDGNVLALEPQHAEQQ